ncbi:hypothetical protein ACFYYV_47700, partial [Streptomyces sp. NPDC001978]
RASGKSRTVAFRFATNRRARVALTTFADNSRLRILARAWLRAMWACWRDGTCYAPATHQANNKINTPADTPLAP